MTMSENGQIRILFEDTDIVIAEKPCGMPSQPDPSGQLDMLSYLSHSRPNLGLVHRLDTQTGGVMVFGKNPFATAELSRFVQDHAVFVKEYLCVTASPLPVPTGDWTDILYHDRKSNKTFAVDRSRKDAKVARLTYRILVTNGDGHSLVLVRLFTGRTHQIRAQFAHRGCPLVGDGKYGSREKAPQTALWAARLTLPHPRTRKTVQAISMPPQNVKPWDCFAEIRGQEPSDLFVKMI